MVKKTIAEIKKLFKDPDNILTQGKLFVGLLRRRSHVKKLLNEGDISQTKYDAFFDACLCFHKETFLYSVKWFPLNNDLLKEAAFLNILEPKSCFQDVLRLCEKLSKHVKFTLDQMLEMEQEFLLLQTITVDDFDSYAKAETTIRVDEIDGEETFRIDVLWHYLLEMKIPGPSQSKFENLFKLAKVVWCIIHSNAEEESIFSRVKKNLTPQRASLSLDVTLSSIISFQLSWEKHET